MTTLIYDGTFDGLLSAVFEVYEYKFQNSKIIAEEDNLVKDFFAEEHFVATNEEKSSRVRTKIKENLGKGGLSNLLRVFLSESTEKERLIYFAISESIKNPKKNILDNFASQEISEIAKIVKSVGRETHRMNAFIRFEKLQDGSFFAKIEPDFNVLPLISNHFKQRYQDQKWMIYDLKRSYGIMWDLQELNTFIPENPELMQNSEQFHNEEEKHFQKIWQRYFIKTGIELRKNPKLHIRHVPKRYWKYLTEKKT